MKTRSKIGVPKPIYPHARVISAERGILRQRSLRFYCFSPPVMLATFIIELSLLIYTVIRYKLTVITRLIIALLFFLALFQLAEYHVCGGVKISANTWSRIGFVAITTLPPLGLHLLQKITGKGWRIVTWIAYMNAVVWFCLFAFGSHTFSTHECAGNYVIFRLNPSLDRYYYFYYYGWLLITMGMALYFAAISKNSVRRACVLTLIGYSVFLLPTTVVNTIDPATTAGVPSIMCGFAVIFAFILVFGIMPLTSKLKRTYKK